MFEDESQVFNDGDVYLYRIRGGGEGRTNYYEVEDDSDQECPKFPIAQYITVVIEENITIRWYDKTITLILNENTNTDTFSLYQDLFPLGLEEFSVSIKVH